jgi:hypothetical protein
VGVGRKGGCQACDPRAPTLTPQDAGQYHEEHAKDDFDTLYRMHLFSKLRNVVRGGAWWCVVVLAVVREMAGQIV